ncbi:MAG: tetratricopeptide repeat protein [Bacteroidaceae bacterium]|nr:tetratricopeptide repeat protein [Bacteroidaceae bacterium]
MRYTSLIITSFIALLLVSCGSREASELFARAEALMDEHPDSALAMLDSVAYMTDGYSRSQRMRYHLLHAKAQNKAYVDFTSDSIMKEVVAYYDAHGTANEQVEAHYLLGCVYRDLGDAPQALMCFENAIDVSVDDSLTHATIKQKSILCSQIGYLYDRQSLYDEAKEYMLKALDCDTRLKDSVNIGTDLTDIGNAYREMNLYDSAAQYYDKAEIVLRHINHKNGISHVLFQRSCLYLNMHENAKALRCLKEIQSCYPESRDGISAMFGMVYDALSQPDSAIVFLKTAISNSSLYTRRAAYGSLINIAVRSNDIESATRYINQYMECSDSINARAKTEAVINMHHLYNYHVKQKKIHELQIREISKNRVIAVCIFIIIVILLLIVIILRHYQMKQLKSDIQLARYRHLEEKMSMMQKENCQPIRTERQNRINSSHVTKDLLALLDKEQIMSGEDWQNVTCLLDDVYPAFLSTLKELRTLNETDMHICMLTKMEFTPVNVSILIGRERSTVTAARKKMYEKTFGRAGKAKDWDEYLLSL